MYIHIVCMYVCMYIYIYIYIYTHNMRSGAAGRSGPRRGGAGTL